MYNTIGNEFAHDNYLGGKGIAYYSLSHDEQNEKLELCLTCSKCKENCPLELDIPALIKELQKFDNPKGYKLTYKRVQQELRPVIEKIQTLSEASLDQLHTLLEHEERWSCLLLHQFKMSSKR